MSTAIRKEEKAPIVLVQKMKFSFGTLDKAEKYYSLLSTLNNLKLAKREIQLLAFAAIKGNIGNEPNKKEFVILHGSSIDTIGNIISRLTKKGILIKKTKKNVIVNPSIALDFKKNIVLQLQLLSNE